MVFVILRFNFINLVIMMCGRWNLKIIKLCFGIGLILNSVLNIFVIVMLNVLFVKLI